MTDEDADLTPAADAISESHKAVRMAAYIAPFADLARLQSRVQRVLNQLPTDVLNDFLSDDRFTVALDDYAPGRGRRVWLACPGAIGDEARSVILKPNLDQAGESFACYVIAHEFAHAHLRNGGWGEIEDREEAADALAAAWGFARPPRYEWPF